MPPNQDSDGMAQISVRLPSWLLDAVDEEAFQRDSRSDEWNRSRILREALKHFLRAEEISPETVEELRGHLEANAGGSEVEA